MKEQKCNFNTNTMGGTNMKGNMKGLFTAHQGELGTAVW